MADVIPFKGVFYNREKVLGEGVIAPPYDIITPEMREALHKRGPYNIARIDSGLELEGDNDKENKYLRAAGYFREWLDEGVLIRSKRPAFYAYRMEYKIKGVQKSLAGLFGAVRIVEMGKGVYPHEATYSKPKFDRMALLKTLEANTSPIFALYNKAGREVADALSRVTASDPYLSAPDPDGTVHSFWCIEDEQSVQGIRAALSESDIFIADGHHRYETALEYSGMMRSKEPGEEPDRPCDYVLMFLADIKDEGLTVLPAHRLVQTDVSILKERLSGYFDIYELPPDTDIIDAIDGKEQTFGLCTRDGRYMLMHRDGTPDDIHPSLGRLDVVILDEMLIKRTLEVGGISYEMDPEKVIAMVNSGDFDAGFFLNPTSVRDVEAAALSLQRMPPKSTYFYPKIQTGFVMYTHK
jgi:uncharacterized protein (DUF1015 family)